MKGAFSRCYIEKWATFKPGLRLPADMTGTMIRLSKGGLWEDDALQIWGSANKSTLKLKPSTIISGKISPTYFHHFSVTVCSGSSSLRCFIRALPSLLMSLGQCFGPRLAMYFACNRGNIIKSQQKVLSADVSSLYHHVDFEQIFCLDVVSFFIMRCDWVHRATNLIYHNSSQYNLHRSRLNSHYYLQIPVMASSLVMFRSMVWRIITALWLCERYPMHYYCPVYPNTIQVISNRLLLPSLLKHYSSDIQHISAPPSIHAHFNRCMTRYYSPSLPAMAECYRHRHLR